MGQHTHEPQLPRVLTPDGVCVVCNLYLKNETLKAENYRLELALEHLGEES